MMKKRKMKRFHTDGCSGGMSRIWRALRGHPPPWEACCEQHDRDYWLGGSAAARRRADIRLLICVAGRGHPLWAMVMYFAVRLGGARWWPSPWRWGYGQPRGRHG